MKKAKQASPKNKARKKPEPILKWQTGEYDRRAGFRFTLPYQFLLLCKLVDVTPEQMLLDFMDNLSCESWKRKGREKAKEKLIEYFLEHGYGSQRYSSDQIREIFKEMDAVGILWPEKAKMKLIGLYTKWRGKHHTYWFRKWYRMAPEHRSL